MNCWNKSQIKDHKKAAYLLDEIIKQTFDFIAKNKKLTEYKIQRFITSQFVKNNLKTDSNPPIVAFNENSSKPHYFPSLRSKKLKPNTLILIDIWAKLNKVQSPFADITWVAYWGDKIPSKILKVFYTVIKARDNCISFIKSQLRKGEIPTGYKIDQIAQRVITKAGYGCNILHRTGHIIGISSPHGREKNISSTNKNPLKINKGYTIEPGIYIKNKFGIRSEINFLIDENKKLLLTTPLQKNIVIIDKK